MDDVGLYANERVNVKVTNILGGSQNKSDWLEKILCILKKTNLSLKLMKTN